MKTFKYLVNGLEVEAKYDEEDIDKVYKPLLNHWYDLYKQNNVVLLFLLQDVLVVERVLLFHI